MQSGRLENVILLTEEGKNTLCSRTPAVHSPHFIFQRPNSREEKERDGVVVGRLKSKTPARSLFYLLPKPIHLGMPSFAVAVAAPQVGRSMSSEKRFLSCVMVASFSAPSCSLE